MALSRISGTVDFPRALSRLTYAANASLGDAQCTRYAAVHKNRTSSLHVTSVRRYPDPPTLPLPTNISQIFANETGRFGPERSRDFDAPALVYGIGNPSSRFSEEPKQLDGASLPTIHQDTHVDSYDCFGAVSLNGTMQSNVPIPFSSMGKSMHLNMPGGQWARDGKYIAEDMQKSHYRSVCVPQPKSNQNDPATNTIASSSLLQTITQPQYSCTMGFSTNATEKPKATETTDDVPKPANRFSLDTLKRTVRDYGATIMVFHIGISLLSLGGFYAAVTRGLNLMPLVTFLGGGNEYLENIVDTSSSFVVAYAIHKLCMPIRIGLTVTLAPICVRYLRRIGVLKAPKVKPDK